ncbi:MAG: M16 family metallopeptidase [Opitutaceae bacterium]
MASKQNSNLRVARMVEPLLKEPVVRFVLPNGLTVLIRPDFSAEVASVQVWVKTGSIHESPWLGSGISHFLEHMLFKGTARRAGREISAVVQEHGGNINAYTTYDRTVYYIDAPSDHAGIALDVLADAVFHSSLPADEVTKERDVILREIDMGLDDPDYRVSQGLMETAFREHPYRHPIIGHREVFERLDRDDIAAYHKSRYVPNNAVLVIAGAVDPAKMRDEIERHFGSLVRSRLAPVLVPDEPGQLAERRIDLTEDVQVYRAAIGYQVPGLTHADTPALDVLSLILGHGDSSVLWQALRERRKLVQSIDASNWNPGTKGLFYISVLADTDKGDRALVALREEMQRACEKGFTSAQLRKAVRQALVAEINVRRNMSGQASRLGIAEAVVGDLAYPATYLKRLSALTVKDLNRVARTWLSDGVLTTATLRPRDAASSKSISSAAARSPIEFEEVKVTGGARLLLRENPRLPQIHLRLVWQGGPMFEERGREGSTSLLATLMTKDTKKRTAAKVAGEIESAGGSFSEFGGNNSFGLSIEVLPDDLDLALDLLEEAALRPALLPKTVEREREAQIADIEEGEDDVVTAGRRRMRQLFFGEHPFAAEASGTAESVARITAATLRALHRKLVVSGNTVMAVSGSFRRSELLPKLKRLLAGLRKAGRPEAAMEFAGPAALGDHQLPQDRQQVVVFEAYPHRGLLAEDFHVSEVADELFSGMSSTLFERVREEKSLAYFVRSGRVVGMRTGIFFLVAGTNTAGSSEVLKEFAAELKRVRAGKVTPAELQRCKTRLKAGQRMGTQSNAACAAHAALNALYGLPFNDREHYDRHIDAVTIEDLAKFAAAQLAPERALRLLAGRVNGEG